MPPKPQMKAYARDEVAQHNKIGDCWIVVDNRVYDVSKFMHLHPGGKHIFLTATGIGPDKDKKGNETGKTVPLDATEAFYKYHKTEVLDKYHKKLCIGWVRDDSTANVNVNGVDQSNAGVIWNPLGGGRAEIDVGSNEGKLLF